MSILVVIVQCSGHLKVDPTAELPFSLSLTDSEKDERSKVKLPYLKDQTGDTELSSGQIFYQPDSVDDFDDEDPDDDLNI
uniref:Elongator complex protein 5 n=1 Tax=Arion vulgaris TaxID=1028688 RepID=A0A0B7B186_9EUPU